MNRRLSILVACLAGTTILGTSLGCGIPGQDTPTVIDATAVPFDLLDPGHGTPLRTTLGFFEILSSLTSLPYFDPYPLRF